MAEQERPLRVWCLAGDQKAHIEPVERWFGNRAEFIYDTRADPKFMLQYEPDIIVCVNDFPYDIMRCLDAARKAVIPSLVLQDGILEWRCQYENPTFGSGGGAPQHQPVIADKIACLGPQSARQIAAWGNVAKVEVTGMPRLDYLLDYNVPSIQRPGNRLLIMTAKKPGFTPAQLAITLQSLRDVKTFLDTRPDIEVVWRITKNLFIELGVKNTLHELASQELSQILCQVDAVVTTISTGMLEAMLLDRPVAALDYHNVPRFVPTAWTISSADHVKPVIMEILDPPANKMAFQRDCLHDCLTCDGPASPRVGELMLRMIALAREARQAGRPLSLPPNMTGAGFLAGVRRNHYSLADLYPDQTIFAETDLEALQVRYARLSKEYERLKKQMETRRLGYWMAVAGRYLSRLLQNRR